MTLPDSSTTTRMPCQGVNPMKTGGLARVRTGSSSPSTGPDHIRPYTSLKTSQSPASDMIMSLSPRSLAPRISSGRRGQRLSPNRNTVVLSFVAATRLGLFRPQAMMDGAFPSGMADSPQGYLLNTKMRPSSRPTARPSSSPVVTATLPASRGMALRGVIWSKKKPSVPGMGVS